MLDFIVNALWLIATGSGVGVAVWLRSKVKLAKAHKEALEDLMFLLTVEEIHAELRKEDTGAGNKLFVRKLAHARGVKWSGKNTRSKLAKRIEGLNKGLKNHA